MSIQQLVNDKRVELNLLRYQNELECMKEQQDDEKIKLLEKAVLSFKKEEPKDKLIDLNHYIYQKPWTRLTEFHKINRLENYINSLTDNKNERKTALTKLKTLLTNKKLTSKTVVYDQKEGKITEITCVKVKDNKIEIE